MPPNPSSARQLSPKITYRDLLAQRELRDNGASTGIDAEYIACHYLLSRGDFKWALKWDDLKLPSAFRWQRTEFGIDVVAEHIDGSIWAVRGSIAWRSSVPTLLLVAP
jgi:hypothetical protein